MKKTQRKFPETIQVYLGSGEKGAKIRENLEKKSGGSVSKFVVELIRKADPTIFEGV